MCVSAKCIYENEKMTGIFMSIYIQVDTTSNEIDLKLLPYLSWF